MLQIPQSTTFLCLFKAYLSSDHTTEATGKTIAITISKNGGAFGNPSGGATNATEISSGWYKVTLSTTDTDTVGPVAVRGAVATIDDVGALVQVVKATNGGLTALPDTAVTTNASLITAGTGTSQLSVSSGQVILQAGTGTGQLDFTSGVVKSNIVQGAGATIPAGAIPNAVAGAAGGLFIAGTNAATVVTTSFTTTFTGNLTGSVGSVTGAVGSVTGAVGSVTGAVGSVTGNVGGNVTGSVGSVTGLTASDVGAIKTKTDFLPSAVAGAAGGLFIAGTNAATTITTGLTTTFTGNLTGSVGSVTGAVGSVTGAVGSVTGAVGSVTGAVGSVAGNVAGSIGSLGATAKSDVNAEVVDAINVDTYAEPTGAPPATASVQAKLSRLYQALRNELTVSATAKTFKSDAGAALWSKALSDDGTTYTEAEGS